MRKLTSAALRSSTGLLLFALVLLIGSRADAFPATLNAWQARYGAQSPSGDAASCQLCHANANGGSPWNGYGWNLREALEDLTCDFNRSGIVTNDEAFFCVELLNSDADGSSYDNATEIGLGTQPGWTLGAFNTLYSRSGTVVNQPAPAGIGPVDPDGTEPPPPPPPPPPTDVDDLPPGQLTRKTIVVRPGQSIQAAIDRASYGTTIYVLAGVYRETSNNDNGLNITKDGIRLIGQKTPKKRVVLENAGGQRNGIVVVPEDRKDCMGCHSDMAPPFPLLPGVSGQLMMRNPMMHGIEIRNITIKNFRNNGLFTENEEDFRIVGVESINNKNYGIFPTLSKNGIITHSRATGSDDSGIWIETSENVSAVYNLVDQNVNGFEVSNSDDILLAHNSVRGNTVGLAILLLPDIFDDRAGAKRIDMRDNDILDNNRPNTATPGSILAEVPPGTGILHLGVDDSLISNNRIENNGFTGIGIADYCLVVFRTPFACGADPTVTPEFIADQAASNNRVVGNVLRNNGTNPPPGPYAPYSADLSLVTLGDHENCYEGNIFDTFKSIVTFDAPPPCE